MRKKETHYVGGKIDDDSGLQPWKIQFCRLCRGYGSYLDHTFYFTTMCYAHCRGVKRRYPAVYGFFSTRKPIIFLISFHNKIGLGVIRQAFLEVQTLHPREFCKGYWGFGNRLPENGDFTSTKWSSRNGRHQK